MSTCIDTEILRRSEVIAHGALTNSKRPSCFIGGVYPTHLSEGAGCMVKDTKGNQYVDFICGLGTNLLGYGQTEVTAAISKAAASGVSLSLGSPLEIEAGEKIRELFPFVEKVRFLKTGTDACNASVRIARAYTGRKFVYSEAYHGWGDEFVSLTPPALGVNHQPYIRSLPNHLCEFTADVAAIIVEPVITELTQERITWLRQLRDYCTQHNIVLIFDEVITGFRFPKFSVSNYLGIEPDLILLGKAMANGMPLAAVAGKSKFMECGEYFVSSTYAGDRASLSAAITTMRLLQTKYRLEELWERGERFLKKFNSIWPEKLEIKGYPTRGVFAGDQETKELFWQEACKAGILFGPSWFWNFEHFRVADSVINTCADIATRIRVGGVRLEGSKPQSPFAQRMREKTQ